MLLTKVDRDIVRNEHFVFANFLNNWGFFFLLELYLPYEIIYSLDSFHIGSVSVNSLFSDSLCTSITSFFNYTFYWPALCLMKGKAKHELKLQVNRGKCSKVN